MRARRAGVALLIAAVLAAAGAESRAAPPAATAATVAAFDPASVPVSARPLPAFPYLDWPTGLKPAERRSKEQDFDQAWFVAGNAPHAAEGRVSRRSYPLRRVGLSQFEAARNYDNALKALGAVRIDRVHPLNKAFQVSGNKSDFKRKKLGIYADRFDYSAWLIRTPETRVWIGLAISEGNVHVTTLEEKAMEQSVALTRADEMKAALDKEGFIALYINFDTDKAALRDDGKPAVDEIAKLLKANPDLKIAVEGHTDNTGNAQRNKALSEQRAATIVAALKTAGIAPARLKSAGFGSDKPVADNRTETGRAANRRVELVKL